MDIGKTSGYFQGVLSISNPTTLCGVITIIAGMFWMHQRHQRLPPGPPLYMPGLGHLLKLANNPLLEFRSLRKTYGDIFRIYIGTRLAVVLNGYEIINEVMQTRGPEFSHRPPSFLAEKLAQYKGLLNTSGKVWIEHKANIAKTFRALASSGNHNLEAEVERLTENLMVLVKNSQAENVNVAPYIRKSICSSAFQVVFGRVLDYDSKELTLFSESLSEMFRHLGGLAVLNFIPYVYLLPGDPVYYHRCIEIVKVIEDELIKPEVTRITQELTSGAVDKNVNNQETNVNSECGEAMCFVAGYIKDMQMKRMNNMNTEMSEEHLVKAAGDLMAGGYDSVSNTLQWWMIYLIHHQDVQEKCRQEVIQAMSRCGGRVTDIGRSELVYTQATIMEVQRLANVGPFPPAHCCDHNTTIRGYDLPKDTIIMTNMDSLMMGPHVGDSPEEFRPERFIGEEGKLVQPKWFMPYATGSRMCIGANIAKKELLAFAAGILYKFKMTEPIIDGHRIMPILKGNLGLTHAPTPFTVCLESVSL